MTDREFITVERSDDGVTTLTIDRPPVHAYNFQLLRELKGALEQLTSSAGVTIITATGTRAFCAGADIKELLPISEIEERTRCWQGVLTAARTFPSPLIAAVNGLCLGSGIGLMTQCDLRLGIETATFGLPEINTGRAGGAAHLRRLVGEGTVRRMLFTGKPLDAAEALRVGLIDAVVPASAWPAAVHERAREMAQRGTELRAVKAELDRTELAGEHGSR